MPVKKIGKIKNGLCKIDLIYPMQEKKNANEIDLQLFSTGIALARMSFHLTKKSL